MPQLESGVKGYVRVMAVLDWHFPIDFHDRVYECCEMCFWYREASKTCGINHEPIPFPGKYRGANCPFAVVTEEQAEKIITAFAETIGENDEN